LRKERGRRRRISERGGEMEGMTCWQEEKVALAAAAAWEKGYER
jgi:hypothetical protein